MIIILKVNKILIIICVSKILKVFCLGQLNWCYTLVENFYSTDAIPSNMRSSNETGDLHRVYESHLHSINSGKSAQKCWDRMISDSQWNEFKIDDNFDDHTAKYNTIYHANYEINTLKWLWEEKIKQSQGSKKSQRSHAHNDNRSVERFNHIFFNLKNIVRTSVAHIDSEDVEKIAREIVEKIV